MSTPHESQGIIPGWLVTAMVLLLTLTPSVKSQMSSTWVSPTGWNYYADGTNWDAGVPDAARTAIFDPAGYGQYTVSLCPQLSGGPCLNPTNFAAYFDDDITLELGRGQYLVAGSSVWVGNHSRNAARFTLTHEQGDQFAPSGTLITGETYIEFGSEMIVDGLNGLWIWENESTIHVDRGSTLTINGGRVRTDLFTMEEESQLILNGGALRVSSIRFEESIRYYLPTVVFRSGELDIDGGSLETDVGLMIFDPEEVSGDTSLRLLNGASGDVSVIELGVEKHGDQFHGALEVLNGSSLDVETLVVAAMHNSSGSVLVDADSSLRVSDLTIGLEGDGTIDVEGALVAHRPAIIGRYNTGSLVIRGGSFEGRLVEIGLGGEGSLIAEDAFLGLDPESGLHFAAGFSFNGRSVIALNQSVVRMHFGIEAGLGGHCDFSLDGTMLSSHDAYDPMTQQYQWQSGANVFAAGATSSASAHIANSVWADPASGLVLASSGTMQEFLVEQGSDLTFAECILAEHAGSTANVILDGAGTHLALVNSESASGGLLAIGGSEATAGGAGTLTIRNGASLSASSRGVIWPGGALNLDGGEMTVGQLVANGGVITGSGTIVGVVDVIDGGVITAGTAPGTLTIDGHLRLGGAGVLRVSIGGPNPRLDYGLVELAGINGGHLELDAGRLEVEFINGFVPQAGAEFDLLSHVSRTGEFSEVVILGGYGMELVYGDQALTLRVPGTAQTACPADIDDSGSVDINDFLAILAGWGPCPASCPADTDGSGMVDINDFLVVLATWGDCP